jgi:hypothetical protein
MIVRPKLLATTILVGIACSFVGVFVGIGLATPTLQQDDSKEIRALMIERREALAKIVELTNLRYERGLLQVHEVCRSQLDLLAADLELAITKEERLKVLNARLESLRTLEKRSMELQKVGQRGGETDSVLMATAARLQAEIELKRDRLKQIESP